MAEKITVRGVLADPIPGPPNTVPETDAELARLAWNLLDVQVIRGADRATGSRESKMLLVLLPP